MLGLALLAASALAYAEAWLRAHLVASPRSRGSHAAPISPHVVLGQSSCAFDPQRALQRHALARDPGLAPRRGPLRFLSEGGIQGGTIE